MSASKNLRGKCPTMPKIAGGNYPVRNCPPILIINIRYHWYIKNDNLS